MRSKWGFIAITISIAGVLLFLIMTNPAFADFFSNFAYTLKDFLFVKLGKILFILFFLAGIVAMSKSLAVAIVLWAIAILLAVGSGLTSAVWDMFSHSSSSIAVIKYYALASIGVA